jgi:hypothetical protein
MSSVSCNSVQSTVGLTFEPATTSIRLTAVVHFAHVHHDRPVVRASDSFGFAGPIAGLLVHFYGDGAAGSNGAFSCDTLGATDVAADVVGADALG